ncbi:MAG: hypothetical protein ABI579_02115 [Candidatus Sumerlaeota bacterium]
MPDPNSNPVEPDPLIESEPEFIHSDRTKPKAGPLVKLTLLAGGSVVGAVCGYFLIAAVGGVLGAIAGVFIILALLREGAAD